MDGWWEKQSNYFCSTERNKMADIKMMIDATVVGYHQGMAMMKVMEGVWLFNKTRSKGANGDVGGRVASSHCCCWSRETLFFYTTSAHRMKIEPSSCTVRSWKIPQVWSDSDDDANAGGKRREFLFSFSSLLKPLRASSERPSLFLSIFLHWRIKDGRIETKQCPEPRRSFQIKWQPVSAARAVSNQMRQDV